MIHKATEASSRIKLRDGHTMPWIGLGVWQTPADQTAEVVQTAIEIGYRAVDTARLYKNEDGVGEGLSSHPDIFVTTKLWNDEQGYDSTLRAFDESARRLKRDVVDLYLIHWPMADKGLYVESWKALIKLREEGRIKSIGVSNFQEEHLERIIDETGEVPVINQIELHPFFQQRKLREFHKRHQIVTEAWRPLGKGAILTDSTIVKIAETYNKTPAQVILRWHLQNDIAVIPKSVRAERMKENIALFDFELKAEDLAKIDALDRVDGRMGPDPANPQF
ncbi:aldo/keto reductase [Aristophania vespae]|uniref:Aldo/keto reductase n=1 Tax=Aristophania vespae TaxID=2697033 RepID=A0A6P1N9Q6_9PROT|nr:aldo/keto reductase [Aristophania vespae]QHI95146.1 aldo/keto reductase [Aristophania vespae]